jgi:hypothetical protein
VIAANFLSVLKFLSYIYLLLLKISRIFPLRMAAARIKLCPCSYFAVAKNLQDYSSSAVQQLPLAGRCKQEAVCYLHIQLLSLRKCDGQRKQRTSATFIQILRASSCAFWQIR